MVILTGTRSGAVLDIGTEDGDILSIGGGMLASTEFILDKEADPGGIMLVLLSTEFILESGGRVP